MKSKVRRFLCLLLSAVMFTGMLVMPVAAADEDRGHVVISQIYGGGGNSGANYKNDFIELYNPTDSDIPLEGWSVQYASASNTGVIGASNITVLPSNTTIRAHGYFLIQEAAGNGGTLELAPDATGSIAMGGTAGKVALVNNSAAIATPSGSSIADIHVVDFVGYGNASTYETAAAPAASNTSSIIRTAYNNNNSTDFTASSPTPRNSSFGLKCAAPAASRESGTVIAGTQVALSCTTSGAAIYFTTDGIDPTTGSAIYVSPITINGDIGESFTVKAIAVKNGIGSSDVSVFTYTIKDPDAVMNIKQVLELPNNTRDVAVTGQIAYFATSYNNMVIQDVIDSKTYSLYIYGSAPEGAAVGDIVKITGAYSLYYGLPELSSLTASEKIGSAVPMAPETVTVSDVKTNGASMLGRFIKIRNVTLGAYNASSNTPVTDSTGTIDIYQATPYPAGVNAGDVVDLYAMVSIHNSTLQLNVGTASANGFNVYDVANDTKAPVITLPDSFPSARTGQDYTISVDAADNKGIREVTITYAIGSTVTTGQAMTKNTENGKYEYTIPGTEIVNTAADLRFTVTATDVTNLTASSGEIIVAVNDKPQITAVTPARNSATGDDKAPEISVKLSNAGVTPSVVMTLKKDGANVITNQTMTLKTGETDVYAYIPDALADGKYTVSVTVTRQDSQSITESWSFTVGTVQYKAYFGQLHAHTAQYSDGSGTLKDGLDYMAAIPESDNVDYVSFTDHSNYFDTTSAANPAEALNDKSKMTAASRTLWDKYVSDMTSFNTEHAGSLVALPGFEMTWSGGPGHINTFNSDGLVSRNNTALNNKANDAGMKLYYETLIQDTDPLANLSQFNHPGTTFGTFSDFAYRSPAYDSKMVAVEVGNGEGAIDSGGYFPSYAEYTKALDKGWHVAPTNNQDNHKGRWGNSNTARTVIITDNLSTDGILQGLKDMSVYSTEDKNLNISYTVNDQMMGSIIAEVPASPLEFIVNIEDPDSDDVISKVEIVTNSGRVASSRTFTSNAADWEFELPSARGYYYVRVTEADKNIAVTAPVWIGQAPLLGINSVESGTKLPVTGEELTLTTTLFNNEESAATVKSVTYSQGSTVLRTETPNTEIASMGTARDTFGYTPDAAGPLTITVTAVLSLNGEDSEFSRNLTLNVRDSERLVYVGIDASHYNEYVDGNYKDSMGNFADMAADEDVRVVELKTGEALIAAAQNPKYKMLVLTPPTRRNGSAFLIGYKSYSDAEIAAVSEFAAAGNTVIVTGWGDYYENYTRYTDGTAHTLPADQHMSAQQNRLLAALGATLRISDDEIKDDAKNGGQAQRLYLTNYNMANPFLNGVKTEEQVYSNYGGSTVYAVDGSGQPVQTLSADLSPMVYAFDTSYSSDDDRDNYAGVTIPRYDGKYMVAASETVQHSNGKTSTVIAAGSAFMSNFEIQATLDSYSTPAYSNYTILENVVRYINPVIISDIADVQRAAAGHTFTVRGIVTSNASGYDRDTAFFDCIYLQDETAGINAFPVSGNIKAGQTVEITGNTSSYNGERQIAVTKFKVIDDSVKDLPAAIPETTAQAADGDNLGSLVTVTGKVVSMTTPNNVVESIYVRDASGTQCRVFIDGYITSAKTIANLTVGATLTATGLSSVDTEGPRIRIRDRADIVSTVILSDIDDVRKAAEGDVFIIRGIVTSNASGFDRDTAFSDSIYLQDETAGINASPVSGNIKAGQTVEIAGITRSYNGERQIAVNRITVIDDSVKNLPPAIPETTAQAANGDNPGSLVTVTGKIVSMTTPNNVVESIYVRDASGTQCRVFIDGYITGTKTIANLAVGATLTATGLSSVDTAGPRIRIRDRADITCTPAPSGGTTPTGNDSTKSSTGDTKTTVSGNTATPTATLTGSPQSGTGAVTASLPKVAADNLIAEAKKAEAAGQNAVIQIKVETAGHSNAVNVNIPKESFNGIATGTKAEVKIETAIGTVKFDTDAVKGINSAATSGDLSISIAKVETLADTVRQLVGDRPVYDFTVSAGSSTISTFGGGSAEVSIPYTLAAGEDPNAIVVYYIDDSGSLQTMRGFYNAAAGTVEFVTEHFSSYVVGYNKVTFSDVTAEDWYSNAVSFIAARGITAGTGGNSFGAEAELSRGQFLTMLMRAYGISPDANAPDNFADAGSTYYTGYLAAAKRLGITQGIGGNLYAPEKPITREDMFTLLYRTLSLLEEVPEGVSGRKLSDFSDEADITDYAKTALQSFVESGVISGTGGALNPDRLTTRAEMAQVLYKLLSE